MPVYLHINSGIKQALIPPNDGLTPDLEECAPECARRKAEKEKAISGNNLKIHNRDEEFC